MKKKAGKRKNELSGCSCSLLESTLAQVGECVLIASRGGPLRYVNDAFLNESGLDAGNLERLVAGKAIKGRSIYSTASIGIAMATPETERPEKILSDAETAMYRAKKMGGAQRVVFEKSMHSEALEAFQLESDLHRAIRHDAKRWYC